MSEAKTVNPLVAKLIAERDRHVIGYPGPRRDVAELLDKAAAALVSGAEQEPVAWPRIMYVCEYCQKHAPEMCGHDRTDLYVLPDGRWLCEGCTDAEGVSASDCVSPPLLYTSPPTSELEALRNEAAAAHEADAKAFLAANARAEAAEARVADAVRVIEDARSAIVEADPNVLTCTLWMPERISPNETVADFLEAAALRVREGGKVDAP